MRLRKFRILAVRIEQRLKAAFGQHRRVAAKRITGTAHHLAGTGDVARLGGQIQQTHLVFDDVPGKTTQGVTPWRLRATLIKILTAINPGTPLWQGPTVRSDLT